MSCRWNGTGIQRPQWVYLGSARGYYNRAARKSYTKPGRAFALPKTAIKWTYERQAWAIDNGFLVAQEPEPVGSLWHRRVDLMILDPSKQADGPSLLAWIKARALGIDEPDRSHAQTLMLFVKQQDEYGYSAAWERNCGNVTTKSKLLIPRWYREYKLLHTPKNRLSPAQQTRCEALERMRAPRYTQVERERILILLTLERILLERRKLEESVKSAPMLRSINADLRQARARIRKCESYMTDPAIDYAVRVAERLIAGGDHIDFMKRNRDLKDRGPRPLSPASRVDRVSHP